MNEPSVSSARPQFALPPGRVKGCLPRKSLPGQMFPMASEKITIIDRKDWPKFLANNPSQMKPFVKVILNQGSLGSCATEACTGGVMACNVFAGQPFTLLNPLSIYATTSGGRDNGSSIDDNLAFAQQYGICPEAVWPRSKGFKVKPSAEAMKAAEQFRILEVFDITTIDEMVSALFADFCIPYGSNGHSVLKVRHIDDNQGEDANSWDYSWGDQGFGVWATYRAVDFSYGAYAIRSVRKNRL
jgi:hypothetical protein